MANVLAGIRDLVDVAPPEPKRPTARGMGGGGGRPGARRHAAVVAASSVVGGASRADRALRRPAAGGRGLQLRQRGAGAAGRLAGRPHARVRRSGHDGEEPALGPSPGRVRSPSDRGHRRRHLPLLVPRQPLHRLLRRGKAEEGRERGGGDPDPGRGAVRSGRHLEPGRRHRVRPGRRGPPPPDRGGGGHVLTRDPDRPAGALPRAIDGRTSSPTAGASSSPSPAALLDPRARSTPVRSGPRRPAFSCAEASNAAYAAPGRLLFVRDRNLVGAALRPRVPRGRRRADAGGREHSQPPSPQERLLHRLRPGPRLPVGPAHVPVPAGLVRSNGSGARLSGNAWRVRGPAAFARRPALRPGGAGPPHRNDRHLDPRPAPGNRQPPDVGGGDRTTAPAGRRMGAASCTPRTGRDTGTCSAGSWRPASRRPSGNPTRTRCRPTGPRTTASSCSTREAPSPGTAKTSGFSRARPAGRSRSSSRASTSGRAGSRPTGVGSPTPRTSRARSRCT